MAPLYSLLLLCWHQWLHILAIPMNTVSLLFRGIFIWNSLHFEATQWVILFNSALLNFWRVTLWCLILPNHCIGSEFLGILLTLIVRWIHAYNVSLALFIILVFVPFEWKLIVVLNAVLILFLLLQSLEFLFLLGSNWIKSLITVILNLIRILLSLFVFLLPLLLQIFFYKLYHQLLDVHVLKNKNLSKLSKWYC